MCTVVAAVAVVAAVSLLVQMGTSVHLFVLRFVAAAAAAAAVDAVTVHLDVWLVGKCACSLFV